MAGPQAEFLRHAERPWFSATFSGSRHTIALAFHGDEVMSAGEALIDALPDHEFAIPGYLVADVAVLAVEHVNGPDPHMTIEVELLLLENL
ncbi:hypothetical protein WSK_1262 [Novosphingobium sp. Rr 2-17]|uniref:hypothetical protein n=1 Tax=Novosphingobium sp. Rr 2-17 TaxID=555793 RepID=UPI0002697E68|nr:hypothetical protein [Novosphingobium sp. Rr 2-17]EIZ80228.1 hypothetical protein WSK_1262 [Novosphingobium sp. Rr 2-17]